VVNKDEILGRIKESVAETAPGATLILYGSYARGDYRDDSDIDVLIILNKDRVTLEDRKVISSRLYRIELDCGIIISPFLHTKSYWDFPPIKTPFHENVNREGIVL